MDHSMTLVGFGLWNARIIFYWQRIKYIIFTPIDWRKKWQIYAIFTTFVVYNTKSGVFATKLSGIHTLCTFF